MRSWSAIARLLRSEARKLAESGGCRDLFLRPLDRLDDDPARVGGVAPFAHAHPLVDLEILIVGEEVLDLLEDDRRQVLPLTDVRIIREGRVDRNADQFLVAAMLVLEVEHADRPRTDDAAGHEWGAGDDQSVQRIAI